MNRIYKKLFTTAALGILVASQSYQVQAADNPDSGRYVQPGSQYRSCQNEVRARETKNTFERRLLRINRIERDFIKKEVHHGATEMRRKIKKRLENLKKMRFFLNSPTLLLGEEGDGVLLCASVPLW